MKDLILFTSSFPFGKHETYLETEIIFLAKKFDKITIYPFFYKNKSVEMRKMPKNVEIISPVLPISKLQRIIIFLKKVFTSPCKPLFFKEFFEKKIFLSYEKLMKWILVFINSVILCNSNQFKILKKKKNSIFYFWWGSNWATALSFGLKEDTNKYFVRLHGGEIFLERSNNYIPINQSIIDNADVLLPISEMLNFYLQKKYNVSKQKIQVSYLAVNSSGKNMMKGSEIISIVSVGNMIELKRIGLIVETLKKIKDKQVNWVHFGDGPLINQIQQYASKDLSSNINFHFFGHKDNLFIMNYYKENYIDLIMNLSKYEGLPYSLIEAMSFGIPCIATDVGGTNELVNNKNGLIIPIDYDLNDLAEEISLCKENEFKNKRHEAYNTWNKKFNAQINYDKLIRILKS